MYDKARGTRSQIELPGPVSDYILENTRNMPDKDHTGQSIPKSMQALLAMMTSNISAA